MMYYNDIYIRHFSHSSLSKKVLDVGASPADDLRESHRLQVADGPVHHLRVRGRAADFCDSDARFRCSNVFSLSRCTRSVRKTHGKSPTDTYRADMEPTRPPH